MPWGLGAGWTGPPAHDVNDEEDRMSSCRPQQRWVSVESIFWLLIELLH